MENLAYPEPGSLEQPPVTCYGCIHLGYRGPAGLNLDAENAPGLPNPGRYECRKLGGLIARADLTPEPLRSNCKEVR